MSISTDHFSLLIAILLVVGVLTTKFSSRIGLPALVFFIAVGMFLNRFIYFDNAALTQLFGILALIVILFEGGMQTKWSKVRPVIVPSLSLATIGVFLTTLVIGAFAALILQVSWLEGMLFGAIVGSTDAAAVFAVLGSKNIKERISSLLEAESGTNDPMAMFLTVSLIQLIAMPDDASFFSLVFSLLWEMGFGLVMGMLLGKASVWVINQINLDSSGLYPVLSLALAIFTYGSTALLHGSGLLAVYVMALVVGNSDLTYRHSIFRFNEGFAWMMQILMFILLGLLVFPDQLLDVTWQGLVLSALLMFVARPVGVFVSTWFTRFSFREKMFIAWAGLRGAVPIVLATYPLLAGLDKGQLFFNVVFFVVLTSALIQGGTISPLANRWGLSTGQKTVVPHSLELVSIGKTNSEMMEIELKADTAAAGREIQSLSLPDNTLITAVIRDDRLITPHGSTRLQAGDILYVLCEKPKREQVKAALLKSRKQPSVPRKSSPPSA
ncbi:MULTISPECIES: potassium/proton antiporter [Brevibacillus]|uniref:potassium/proton antiporter n=1 Tax=Brevibacillus TaxID=55080 RepID=UPI000408FFA8|nr:MULTISPECIES: potassium/proton antiporter [Brevibacillus]UYZ12318.1 potassium/proton antiporter [Brevibacillus sp. WF146]